jgi:hypothetical protein
MAYVISKSPSRLQARRVAHLAIDVPDRLELRNSDAALTRPHPSTSLFVNVIH